MACFRFKEIPRQARNDTLWTPVSTGVTPPGFPVKLGMTTTHYLLLVTHLSCGKLIDFSCKIVLLSKYIK